MQMLTRRRNPLGAWGLRVDLFVARRQRCTRIASSSRLDLDPQAPCARHILILGQAPRGSHSNANNYILHNTSNIL
jgi:hypothetical protein